MPSVSKYKEIRFTGFSGGLNNHADSSRLVPTEMSMTENVRLGPRGEVELRTGYTRRDQNIPRPVSFMTGWRSVAGVDYMVTVDSIGQGWYDQWDRTDYEVGLSITLDNTLANYGVAFAAANDKLYISSKGNARVHDFNGVWTSGPGTIPICKLMHFRHGRLFTINHLDYPSRIYYSELEDPENFPVANVIDVSPQDGEGVNASAMFGDDIILFKDHSMWKLSGREPNSFNLYRIDNHRGCVSPKAVDQLRGRLIFYDRASGVWAFDGAELELISEPINDYLLENQWYDLCFKANSYVADDRYYLTLRWTGETPDRTFVYHADVGAWTEYETGFLGATESHDLRFLGLPNADGLYIADPDSQAHPPFLDPIVGTFRTGWILLGGPGVKARVRRLEMTIKSLVGSTGTIRMFRDYDEDTPYITRTFPGGPAAAAIDADERRVAIDGWGNRVHAVMFEFEFESVPFQVNQFTLFYTGGEDIRGHR